jgi:hypothetical protein
MESQPNIAMAVYARGLLLMLNGECEVTFTTDLANGDDYHAKSCQHADKSCRNNNKEWLGPVESAVRGI